MMFAPHTGTCDRGPGRLQCTMLSRAAGLACFIGILAMCGCQLISTENNPYRIEELGAASDTLAHGQSTLVSGRIRSISGGDLPDSVVFRTGSGYFISIEDSTVLGTSVSVPPSDDGEVAALLFNPFSLAAEAVTVELSAGGQTQELSLLFIPAASGGPACAVSMKEIDFAEIAIRGSGTNEVSRITFQVTGAAGFPVSDGLLVDFAKQGPGGAPAESLLVNHATTQHGVVATAIRSGTRSGTVQVTATVRGTLVSSAVVPLVIQGGLPHKGFSLLLPSARNVPGVAAPGATASISATYYDVYHNPARPGTAVYFTANSGGITASGFLDASGHVAATFATGRDTPANRLVYVWANTHDDSGNAMRDSIAILLSGPTVVSVAPEESLAVGDTLFIGRSQGKGIVVTACDDAGNPLAAGTSIAITVSAGRVVGAATLVLEDTIDPSRTRFPVQWLNDRTSGAREYTYLSVRVTSRNGDKQAGLWANIE